MTTKIYFIVENGTQAGPFTFDVLKSKDISPETLIWFDGLEKWKHIKDIPDLSALFEKRPPPISEVENGKAEATPPPVPVSDVAINNIAAPAFKYELATIGSRLGGYLIINVITLILFFAFDGSASDLESSEGFFWDMIYAGIGTGIINCIFYPFFSGNLGHKLMGLKVIKKSDGSPVRNIFSAYGREFTKGALSVLIIPILWLVFDEDRQNLYDKIQGTIVVKNND